MAIQQVEVQGTPTRRDVAEFAWSLFDRTAATLGVLFLLPALAIIAIAVRLTSNGPALFRQTRIGQYGAPFTIYKFRTMHVDAEEKLLALMAEHGIDPSQSYWKFDPDPRVTRLGRLLRRTSLDELPQLFNVMRGDMRLVGPRPHLPEQVSGYASPQQWRRLLVKPGITGLWQVSGRSDLDAEAAHELDERYVREWTGTMDARVLARTALVVVTQRGAC